MSEDKLRSSYYSWMCQLVYDDRYSNAIGYSRLLGHLYDRTYHYMIGFDANRESNGIELRYIYAFEHGISYPEAASALDIYPCSILEMMIALSVKCEEIMSDPAFGNRTGEWFWQMIRSLGLIGMNDQHYDEAFIDNIIDRFISNEYESDGRGGLFWIKGTSADLRMVDIWTQMHWFLNEYYKEDIDL